MKTTFLLMAQYDGMPVIPVERVCKDFFAPLTVDQLLCKIGLGEVSLPVMRTHDGPDATLFVHWRDLVDWIDEAKASAADNLESWLAEMRRYLQPERTGFVYLIEAAGLVKIGFTVNVEARIRELQAGSPIVYSLLTSFPATMTTERDLHKRFADYRSHREWFRLDGALADWIAGGCSA